jgi:acetolactate synthase I/III small subunit
MSPTSAGRATGARHHILTVTVENKAGVLARVASLFSRRGYNIFSLAVAPTDDERLSRITIVVDVEGADLEQITKQLFKLVNVVKISELDPAESTEMELVLATVRTGAEGGSRSQIIELVGIFGGRIVDVSHDTLTVALADTPAKIDDFEELMRAYGIVELQRTGRVALPKLDRQAPRLRRVTGKVG